MGLYLRKNVWWMCYMPPGGKYVRESTNTGSRKLAEAIYAKRRVQIAENKHLDVKRETKLTFRQLAELFLERHSKPKKKSWKSADLVNIRNFNRFFGDIPASKVTQEKVEEYLAIRRSLKVSLGPNGFTKYLAPATLNRELTCLKTMFNKAIEWGYLDRSPCARIKKLQENNKRTRFLTYEEMERLLAAATPKLKEVLLILLHTGMRRNEFRHLTWADLDFDRDLIRLTHTKNGKVRYIPMNKAVKEALLRRRIAKEDPILVFPGQKPGKAWDFTSAFEYARKRAGIADFHIHDLRHTFASHLCMNGADLMTIKELLGHSSLDMTERYSHLTDQHKAMAVAKLEGLPVNSVTILSHQGE